MNQKLEKQFEIIKESFNQFPEGLLISRKSPTVQYLWEGIHTLVHDYLAEDKRYINKKDFMYLRDTLKFLEVIIFQKIYRQDKIVEEESNESEIRETIRDC